MVAHVLDWFLEEVFRLPIKKALDPNDPVDFNKIVAQLTAATKGLAQPAEAKALKLALEALDVDWKNLSAGQKSQVVTAAKQSLNPIKLVLPRVQEHFEANAQAIGMQTKSSAVKQFGFGIGVDLDKQESDTLWHVALSQGNYVRDEYGKRSDAFALKAKEIVARGLEQGLGRKDIASELKTQLTAQQFNRSEAYWSVISGAFVNRARTFTNLSTYESAGVVAFEFDAVLDQRTSTVCRFMHGKRFPVAAAKRAYRSSEEGPEDVKAAQPWVSEGRDKAGNTLLYYKTDDGVRRTVAHVEESGAGQLDETGKFSNAMSGKSLQRAGIMTPPLHGNCRSTINPVLGEGGVVSSAPGQIEEPGEAAPAPAPAPFALTPPEAQPAPPAAPSIFKPPAKEQESLLFGPGGIANAQIVDLTPLQPTAPPVKAYISPSTKKKQALDALQTLVDQGDGLGMIFVPFEMASSQQIKDYGFGKNAQLIEDALKGLDTPWKPAMKAISNLKAMHNELDPAGVKKFIENPKLLEQQKIKVVEVTGEKVGSYWKKNLVIVEGHDAMAAQQLLGKDKVKIEVINLKEWTKLQQEKAKAEALKPKAAPLPPAPVPPPPPLKPPAVAPVIPVFGPPADLSNILHNKTAGPKGSNEGGFYTGADGKQRYVKFYADEAQAHGEVLANSLYRSLGFDSPNAVTTKDPATGKNVYAVDIMQGQTLGSAGVNKKNAKEFMRGFAADVLMGNWDAAGMSADNAFVLNSGSVIRIDNGGSFLMRAKAGRKPDGVLGTITEWDYFFDPVKNPGYHKIAKAAGYDSPDDFKDDVKKQIADIVDLRKKVGGWRNYVEQHAPALNAKDKQAVIDMLEKRTDLLKGKLDALNAPPPKLVPPGPQRDVPMKYRGPSLSNGVAPSPSLRIEDLPTAKPPPKMKGDKFDMGQVLPWGEPRPEFKARSQKVGRDLGSDANAAVKAFSGNSFGAIRNSEAKGKPNAQAKAIADGFARVPAEAVTTYRGISNLPKAVVEAFIRNEGVFRFGIGNTPGTTSTAWHPESAIDFMGGTSEWGGGEYKVFFTIHGRSGIPIEGFSVSGQHECEILMPADAQFKIRQVARWEGKQRIVHIELEEI